MRTFPKVEKFVEKVEKLISLKFYLRLGAGHHERAKLILKTRPKMHTKHCVLEKDSLNPLRFAK